MQPFLVGHIKCYTPFAFSSVPWHGFSRNRKNVQTSNLVVTQLWIAKMWWKFSILLGTLTLQIPVSHCMTAKNWQLSLKLSIRGHKIFDSDLFKSSLNDECKSHVVDLCAICRGRFIKEITIFSFPLSAILQLVFKYDQNCIHYMVTATNWNFRSHVLSLPRAKVP